MQPKDDLVHKVLNVTRLWASNKHHPVMGEALRRGLLPQLGTVTQLQLHLDRALVGGGVKCQHEREPGRGGEQPAQKDPAEDGEQVAC